MTDLIARLEKATGPDRALDGAIEGIHPSPSGGTPRYTASLDAALTLVPEGWTWLAGDGGIMEREHDNEPRYGAIVFRDRNSIGALEAIGHATPAIAICIAALKAREGLTAGKAGET